jgi:hypothetical protein
MIFQFLCTASPTLSLEIPEVQAYHRGREVIFVFEKDVSPAIVSACEFTDAMH